jgi:activator of 2-hydroxyglutaryl-CoA dehydratase
MMMMKESSPDNNELRGTNGGDRTNSMMRSNIPCTKHMSPRTNISTFTIKMMMLWVLLIGTTLVPVLLLPVVQGRAILGVDMGSLYMKVALVQSGNPIEIVTNLHSKRKTEQMILLESNKNHQNLQRFYGADAAALLARKASSTPTAMSVMLGRLEEHPTVRVRRV